MRRCEAWEPVGKCFDPISFECIDFQGVSHIFACLTRENLAQREAEIRNLSWRQTEKDNAFRNADLDFALGAPRNQCSAFMLLPMKTAIPWKTKMNQAGDYEYWCAIFQARVEGQRHHHYENTLRYVQKARDDIRWEIDRNEFDELLDTKKESALGPDGIPYSLYRCAGGLGSQVLFNAYKHVLECGTIPAFFFCFFLPKSRIVFIPNTTRVEFEGMTRGQFLTASGVRQCCLASGFLFAMAFDLIFLCLQDAIIPRNPDGLDFLKPAQCAYADNFAVVLDRMETFTVERHTGKNSSACADNQRLYQKPGRATVRPQDLCGVCA